VLLYLFDIDGTLLHAHGSGRDAFDQVLAEQHGITAACQDMTFGGKTDPGLLAEIFATRLGRAPTAAEHAAFVDAYVPRLRELLPRHGVEVIAGVVEALEYLATRSGVRLGIATGNVRAGAEAKLAAAGLSRWFALGGYGCDSAVRAELVAAAIRRAGDAREVVVVGDRPRHRRGTRLRRSRVRGRDRQRSAG
jgi:phosphoglycolate phosphatase-like HAD superfamily hydrolase